jgi:energy-coupling factor transport system ATP-binding protein
MDPPALVIDEPTTGMDRVGAVRVMELLSSWAAQGRAIVAITHDMDIVSEYMPRSVVMAEGRILADGPTQEVLRDAGVLRQAHLAAPAPVVISDALEPFGVNRAPSIEDAVKQVVSIHQGGLDARRIQRLP